jgi:ribosomal protein S12 methylthiotransferase
MDLQAEISMGKNRDMMGSLQEVLVEGYHEETPLLLKGRTKYQAPEIDGIVCINKGHIQRPGMATVRITDFHIYDLIGEIVSC